jgi:hypothetical protein
MARRPELYLERPARRNSPSWRLLSLSAPAPCRPVPVSAYHCNRVADGERMCYSESNERGTFSLVLASKNSGAVGSRVAGLRLLGLGSRRSE